MIAYYSVFMLGAVGSLFESLGLRRVQLALGVFLFWLLLALFAGLRGEWVSDDYFNYLKMFDEFTLPINAYLSGEPLPFLVTEPLFFLILTGVKTLQLSFPYVVFIVAVVATWIVYRSVCIYSPFPVMSLLLYFGHAYLNREMVQMQSGLAIAMVLYSIRFITERDPLKYHLMILAATCVHTVAFMAMPFYLLLRMPFSNMVLFGLLGLSGMMAVVDWLHPVLNVLLGYGVLPGFVAGYVGYQKYDYALGVLNNLATLKQLALLLPMMAYRKELEERFSYFRELFLFYAAATCWLIAFHHMAILAARIATVFAFAEIVLIAMLVSLVRERFFAFSLAAALGALSLVGNLAFKGAWRPYSLILN